jgi:hypothetical protein
VAGEAAAVAAVEVTVAAVEVNAARAGAGEAVRGAAVGEKVTTDREEEVAVEVTGAEERVTADSGAWPGGPGEEAGAATASQSRRGSMNRLRCPSRARGAVVVAQVRLQKRGTSVKVR